MSRFWSRRLAAAVLGLLVGGSVTVMSAPILAGAAAALPGDAAARELRQRQPLDAERLLTVLGTRAEALRLYPAVEWRRELASASVMPRDGRLEPSAVARSKAQTRTVLLRAPASPHDWMRLAVLETMTGNRAAAARYLSTALLTGADMPRLRWNVISVGLALWDYLPHHDRIATLDVMRHAWRAHPGNRLATLRYARDRGLLPLARLALSRESGFQEAADRL